LEVCKEVHGKNLSVVLKRTGFGGGLFGKSFYKSDKDIPKGRPSSLACLCYSAHLQSFSERRIRRDRKEC
jgi:hypothetical protein